MMRVLQISYLLLAACVSASAQEPTLRWNFKQGDSEDYRLTQTANVELALESGKQVAAKVERELEWQWQVSKTENEGTAWISVKVTGVRLHVTGPAGEETKFDSKSKEEPRGFAATLAPLFRTLMKSEIRVPMTTLGEVDPNEIVIPEDLNIVINTKPVGKALGTIANKEDLLVLANLSLHSLPDTSWEPSQNWDARHSIETIPFGSTEATTMYRLKSVDDSSGSQIATIVPETTIRFVEPDAKKPLPRIVSQESSGKILFDSTSGRLISSESKQKIELETYGGGQSATGTLRHELKLEIIEADASS